MKTSKPSVVIDTNIVFSALYDLRSKAGRLLFFAIEDRIELIASRYIKEELERNLKDKLGYTDEEFKETVKALPIRWIEDERYLKEMDKAAKLIAHKRDVPILALALSMKCGVVSGDEHFLKVEYKGLKLWKLTELIASLEEI
ncbi:PIN domain-containing protein [archaeon]|nr:PIN domain-containing protein [archaeon]